VKQLGVVGNISIDCSNRVGTSGTTSIGGAALYVALSATRAGFASRPLSLIGTDPSAPRPTTASRRTSPPTPSNRSVPGATITTTYAVDVRSTSPGCSPC
jgi:sugar/nucleoside kinase (ribokinase family)